MILEKIPHIRNYEYEVVCGAVSGTSYPEEYEIPRENTGTLRNQKFENCVAEVIAQLAEAFWGTEFDYEEHSEGWIYGKYRYDNSTGTGLIVSYAMDCWTKLGTIPKKNFNIDAEMPEIKKIVSKYPELLKMAKKYKIPGYVHIKGSSKESRDTQIKDAFIKYNRGLVAVSYSGFSGGSHCVMLTGWNDKKDKYKFKNSWGEKYGDKGFSEIDKGQIDAVYLPIFEPIKLPFTDVDESRWSYKAIKNMYFSGMMNGMTETTFEPTGYMTREQVAVLLDRLIDSLDQRFDILGRLEEDKKEYL